MPNKYNLIIFVFMRDLIFKTSLEKIRAVYKKDGFRRLFLKSIRFCFRVTKNFLIDLYFKFLPKKTFYFQNRQYRYLYRTYNKTWQNERAVEVPIFYELVQNFKSKNILEVGNVLRNYYSGFTHDVIDKYERGDNILNYDVADFQPKRRYDLIFSISTMEHVGWDEEEKKPEKILDGFKNLIKNCLSSGGTLAVSMPLGYNHYLDFLIKTGKLEFSETYFLKRVSNKNEWQEVSYEEVNNAIYGYPFPNANVVVIGIYRSKD